MPQGTLRITAPVSYGESRIAPLVNDFMVRFPQLEVTLNLTNQLLDLVHEGYDWRCGSAISRIRRWWRASWRSGCPCLRLTGLHRSPRHAQQPLRADPPHLSGGQRRRVALYPDGRPHSVRVRGLLQCNSGHALLDAALKGIGIIQLPDYYVSDHLARGELIELLPELRAPAEGIWALYPHNRHLSPRCGCWWTTSPSG